MDNYTIIKLDILLSKMVETDFFVTANDLVKNGYYSGIDINEIVKDFKYLQSIFKDLNVADISSTQDAELISPTHKSILFQKNGGFKLYYKNLENSNQESAKEKSLERQINELTKTNLQLQNKDLRRKIIFSIIGFLAGAISTNIKDIILLINSLNHR